MKNPHPFKYPDINPLLTGMAELFKWPGCGSEIEIRSDEVGGRCTSYSTYYRKPQQDNMTEILSNKTNEIDTKLKKLIQYARKSGASEAVVIPTRELVIEDSLAARCSDPQCENYGLSKSCPPNVSGPDELRKYLESIEKAIFFKIDVPSEILFSSEGRELFRLLHEIASGIEKRAIKMGFPLARAYAGGSCKKAFCHDHPECQALSEKAECRHPESARPSMSGFGVNVLELFKTVGWKMNQANHDTDSAETNISSICGLVLIC